MKYKHVKGLELQKPAYMKALNRDIRALLNGQEVKLDPEEVLDMENLGVILEEVSVKKKEKKKKNEIGEE
jgi:hypothetical protein